jgi:hypothetical protein
MGSQHLSRGTSDCLQASEKQKNPLRMREFSFRAVSPMHPRICAPIEKTCWRNDGATVAHGECMHAPRTS